MQKISYSVAIRTLGKAGDYYQKTLDSFVSQTIQPEKIVVYIADGCFVPKETIGREEYVWVEKGMVAQRALEYNEIDSEYMLLLDDDVFLPDNAVEVLYKELKENEGDVISPIVFYNSIASIKQKLIRTITGREVCRFWSTNWANKVLRTAGFSYNNAPSKPVYPSQSNAGPCLFCKKEVFLKIRFQDELWLDQAPYAIPEDQVMFYKMHKRGLRVLSSFDSGIIHMDASTTVANSDEKTLKIIYSEYRNKLIFWHRFIFLPSGLLGKIASILAIIYAYGIQFIKYFVKRLCGDYVCYEQFVRGLKDGWSFIHSVEYRKLERI